MDSKAGRATVLPVFSLWRVLNGDAQLEGTNLQSVTIIEDRLRDRSAVQHQRVIRLQLCDEHRVRASADQAVPRRYLGGAHLHVALRVGADQQGRSFDLARAAGCFAAARYGS